MSKRWFIKHARDLLPDINIVQGKWYVLRDDPPLVQKEGEVYPRIFIDCPFDSEESAQKHADVMNAEFEERVRMKALAERRE